MKGQKRCARHGGKSPQAKRAAERRLAEHEATRNMEKAVRTLGTTDKYQDIDPGKALLEEISVTYAHVQWLREKDAELDGDDLAWGKVSHEEGGGLPHFWCNLPAPHNVPGQPSGPPAHSS